jgi:hypothetical protein
LSDTSTELENAQGEIVALQATATQASELMSAEATQAAATQAALAAEAATQQAQAAATQTAQANAAATQGAQAEATQVAYAAALDESEANAAGLAQDLATQAYVATQAAEAAAALQATATLQADAIETLSQDYSNLVATATQVVEAQATLAVDTMATMVALGYREDGSDVPVAPVEVIEITYDESFDDNRSNIWYEGNFDQGGSAMIVDGRYAFTLRADTTPLWTGDLMTTQTNQLIEVRFRMDDCQGSFDASGIEIALFTERNSAYLFTVWCNHNEWSLGQIEDGENTNLGFGRFETNDYLFEEWHTLSVQIGGEDMTFYMDGTRLTHEALQSGARGTTFVQMFSQDNMRVELDSIRVWNLVPTEARNTNTLTPVVEPTPAPLTSNEERDLLAELEAIADALPSRITIDGRDWRVQSGLDAEYVDGMVGIDRFAAISRLLEGERGESVIVIIYAYSSEADAAIKVETTQLLISDPFDEDLFEDFPTPNYFGEFEEGIALGGWAQGSYEVSLIFWETDSGTPEDMQALGLWLTENLQLRPKRG